MDIIGKCVIVSVSPAHHDTIYVGIVVELGDRFMVLKHATNVVHMRGSLGVSGYAGGPHPDGTLKPMIGGGHTVLYIANLNVFHFADVKVWAQYLPGFTLDADHD